MSELTIYVKADWLTCRNAVDTTANQSGPMIVSVVSEYKPVRTPVVPRKSLTA